MKVVRLSLIPAFLILQTACHFQIGAVPRINQKAPKSVNQVTTPITQANVGPEYNAYVNEVRKHWANNNYEWLEGEARRLGESKDRLPGGYWKLRVLYQSIEGLVDRVASDDIWQKHIANVETWIKEHPAAAMPRIILADLWRSYAWKARGTGYANTVEPEGWKTFDQRLDKTIEILGEAANLEGESPEWYLTALLAARGRGHDREAFEKLFEQSIRLEPTYYYLYQAKAGYLLPQWYGERGEWERFAEEASNRVGGEQGDIILFTVYTFQMSNSSSDFMNTRQAIAPRLLAGFRAIDKLYGSSPQRLNEACLISFFAGDNEIPAELMKRIGNNYDLTVWKDDSNFNIFRQEALMRVGKLPRYGQSDGAQKQ